MAIRYSKRQPDGSVEHYDSKEEMESANSTPMSWPQAIRHVTGVLASDFNPLLAALGFFVGGALCLWLMSDVQILAKWARFFAVLLGATTSSYILGRLGNVFFMLIATFLVISVAFGGGYLLWKLL